MFRNYKSRNFTGLLLFGVLLLNTASCRKNYSKEGYLLPEILKAQANVSNCSPCPFYIQVVELNRDTYFIVIPEQGDPGIVCDWFTGAVIYDANSIRIEFNSDLYSKILDQGKKKKIVFDCP